MLKETGLWIINNPIQAGEFVLAVIGAASVIVKATPTPKDDVILGKIKKFVSKMIALNTEVEKIKVKVTKK